jgi:hypothetical protein
MFFIVTADAMLTKITRLQLYIPVFISLCMEGNQWKIFMKIPPPQKKGDHM